MFKISDTICWEIRSEIQYKTQQPQKRCNQEGQYTSIKLFSTLEDIILIHMRNLSL